LVAVGSIFQCWNAYREGLLEYLDVRVWLACHEMKIRRCQKGEGVPERYDLGELRKLVGGVGGKHLQKSLGRLQEAGFLCWSETAITFPKFAGDPSQRRLVPFPRPMLRFLAGCDQPGFAAAVLGLSIRCLRRHRDKRITHQGTC